MMYRTLLTEKQQKRTSIPTRLPFTQAIADARNSRKLVQEFKKQKKKAGNNLLPTIKIGSS